MKFNMAMGLPALVVALAAFSGAARAEAYLIELATGSRYARLAIAFLGDEALFKIPGLPEGHGFIYPRVKTRPPKERETLYRVRGMRALPGSQEIPASIYASGNYSDRAEGHSVFVLVEATAETDKNLQWIEQYQVEFLGSPQGCQVQRADYVIKQKKPSNVELERVEGASCAVISLDVFRRFPQ